jgi:hypothetical protein
VVWHGTKTLKFCSAFRSERLPERPDLSELSERRTSELRTSELRTSGSVDSDSLLIGTVSLAQQSER